MQLPQQPSKHVKPFIREDLITRTMHFSIVEIQSRMSLMDPYALDLEYTRLMMGFLLFVPDPGRITMIGLGGGSLAKFCHRHLPRARIEVIEINPHVIELRKEFHVPRNDRRFRVVEGDGARFVAVHPGHSDVLLVDGYDYDGQPSRLCSKRFYDDARRSLRPGGVLVANLHTRHCDHALHLQRLGESFLGDLLIVECSDTSNAIVFARVSGALHLPGRDAGRRAGALAHDTAEQLQPSLDRVATALNERCQ